MQTQTFGRYELLELLAQGGMGQVYRALLRGGPGFAKEVALKRVLKALSADPIFVTRFADEARIASTLSHGNIVQVFDFGEVEGEYYLAMEFIDGPDLGTLMQAARTLVQPLPVPFALQVGAGLCRGLGAAHGRKDIHDDPAPVVHRDVSPPNVLLTRAGEVKVTDFGIAKAADKALRTQTGMVMGKCRYMSPEQAAGETVDTRTDIFSAGCLLYELLVGQPLFAGRTADQILRNVLLAPIPRASDHRAEIPAELDTILARALHRDYRERYTDGTALARDLESLLHTLAPHYSRDDVAALTAELVPPRPRLTPTPQRLEGEEAPATHHPEQSTTQPPAPMGEQPTVEAHGGTELGIGAALPTPRPPTTGDTGDTIGDNTDAATAPRPKREASPRGTPEQETALLERGDLAKMLDHDAAVPSSAELSTPAKRDEISSNSSGWQPKPSRRRSLMAGGIAGLTLGILVGAFWPTAPPLADAAAVQSGPWHIGILEGQVHRGQDAPAQRRVALVVRARGSDSAAAPRHFSLRREDGPLSAPLAWQRQSPTKTLLIFAWPPGRGQLRLRFAPPDAPAVEIEASLVAKATP